MVEYIPKIVKKFLGLEDTPNSYSGQSGKVPRVKTAEDGLEFAEVGLEYVEIHPPGLLYTTTYNVWQDWDLSAYIPSGAKYAEIWIYIPQDWYGGVRKKGSSVDRKIYNALAKTTYVFTAHGESHENTLPLDPISVVMTVELNANRVVERYASWVDVKFQPIGYWK